MVVENKYVNSIVIKQYVCYMDFWEIEWFDGAE